MDIQHMTEAAQKHVTFLNPLLETLKDVDKGQLPLIDDPDQIKSLEEMVPMNLQAIAKELMSAESAADDESPPPTSMLAGTALTSALDAIPSLLDSRGDKTLTEVMAWLQGLWGSNGSPSFQVGVSEADRKNLQALKTTGVLNIVPKKFHALRCCYCCFGFLASCSLILNL